MKETILVFIGGGTGSLLRFWISRALNNTTGLPFGTWTVNIAGSLLIGLFLGISWKHAAQASNMSLLLITGFCGGFTTFSTFSQENLTFLKAGELSNFVIYTGSSLSLALLAVFAGSWIARFL